MTYEPASEYPASEVKRNRRPRLRYTGGSALIASLLTAFLFLSFHVSGLYAQQSLTILHSSEHHGTALPIERPGEKRVGGMASRAALIQSIRRQGAAVLVVDSGDILVGSALSSFFRGEPDVKAMNVMGYDVMAAGNHDFDFGLKHLERLSSLAMFPILCSNLQAIDGRALPCRSSAIIQAGDLTLGVIGLLGQRNFPDSFNRDVVKHLALNEPIQTGRALAQALKEQGADLVVAVTHQETQEDLALLARAPEIDVIIGGHTGGFDGLRSAKVPGAVDALADPGPVFVKTHREGRTLGRLDLVIAKQPKGPEGAKVLKAKARNLPVSEDIAPQPEVHALIEGYRRKLEAESATVVGRSLVRLDGENSHIRSRETNLGNLLADILRERFGTDIALVNGGQIRDSIPPGPVTIKRVLSVLPFNSPVVTFTITGEQLSLALENSASRLPGFNGRFLQVSGLSVTYDASSPPGKRVRQVTVNEEPLDLARGYTVATDSFLADSGDGYTMFALAKNRIDRGLPLRDLLLAALGDRPLKASVRGRIRFIE